MRVNQLLLCVLFSGTMLGWSAAADEANTDRKSSSEVTVEQRKQMAQVHEKMATCLRSNKPLNQCRSEMRSSCQEMMGKDGCPMMGKMGHMGGKGAAETDEVPKNVISMSSAKAAALKEFPGTVKSSELEEEKGKWVYSFDIVGGDKNITEVWVDAKNGQIVKHEVESAAEESREAEHG